MWNKIDFRIKNYHRIERQLPLPPPKPMNNNLDVRRHSWAWPFKKWIIFDRKALLGKEHYSCHTMSRCFEHHFYPNEIYVSAYRRFGSKVVSFSSHLALVFTKISSCFYQMIYRTIRTLQVHSNKNGTC